MNIRNYSIDNAKLILMLMVVFAHLLEPIMVHSDEVRRLYSSIYLFHMPAFIFLAGVTSKAGFSSRKALGLLVTFIVFQFLYVALFTNHELRHWTQPYWILWFLISLFCWRALVPVFKYLRFPVVIAILIALAAGFIPAIGYPLSLSRTLVFLPFFIAGYLYGERVLNWCAILRYKALLGLPILIAGICIFNDVRWQYGSYSYQALGMDNWLLGSALRLTLMAISAVGVVIFMSQIPNKQFSWTYRGGNVLAAFLLHGLFVIPTRNTFSQIADYSISLAIVGATICSIILMIILTTGSVK